MIGRYKLKINRTFGLKYYTNDVNLKSYLPYYTYKDGKTPLPDGWVRFKDENERDFYIYLKNNLIYSSSSESSNTTIL
jgi:hypothetical protein